MKARITALTLLTATAILAVSAQQARQDEVQQLPAAEADSGTPATFWWGDCDGDGLLDAYALAPGGEGLLLRNQGDGSFEDATLSAGLAGIEAPTAAAWGDFDGDGDLDLFLGTAFGQARLMRGLGDGSFEGAHVGIDHLGWDQRAAWIDYDSDGHLDLQVRTKERDLLYHNLGRGLFEPVDLGLPGIASLLGELCADPAPDAAEVETGSPARPVQPAAGAPPATTGSRTPVAPGPGTAAARGPGLGGSTPLGPHTPGMPAPTCMDSIMDQANPLNCVNASSIPTFGMLYPLGNEFNIDASGHVGVGTTSPAAQLHVFGSPVTIQANNSNGGGVAVRAVGAGAFGFGVKAEASYESGTGVYGAHTAATGTEPGVHGVSHSTEYWAAGVQGEATAAGGQGTGVRGVGITGVHGLGEGYGVFGNTTTFVEGYAGVFGADQGTGVGIGVKGMGHDGGYFIGEEVGVKAEAITIGGGGERYGGRFSGYGGAVGSNYGVWASGSDFGVYSQSGEVGGYAVYAKSTHGTGVHGEHTEPTGLEPGIHGVTRSVETGGAGVLGEATENHPWGSGYGVIGRTWTNGDGAGVLGEVMFLSAFGVQNPVGVRGISEVAPHGVGGEFRGTRTGVIGEATGTGAYYGGYFEADSSSSSGIGAYGKGEAFGLYGRTTGSGGTAVKGYSNTGDSVGLMGAIGPGSIGASVAVHGQTESGSASTVGVLGEYIGTAIVDARGVEGISTPGPYYGVGGHFEGGWRGVAGYATVAGYGSRYAGIFSATGGEGIIYGVYATADDPQNDGDARALYASTSPSDGYAGSFAGNVEVTGTLSKGGGSFKIDHPLDPENKYLYHSFVESPDMMNVYNGNAFLDERGSAWVEMPEWFEALNRDFRYQLTPIGAPGPTLFVAEEISGNRFRIAGGQPFAKVSWQVTGIRQDPFAEANRIPVEVDKQPEERGLYLHPEARGLARESGIDYVLEERPMIEKEAAARAAAAERRRVHPVLPVEEEGREMAPARRPGSGR